MNSWTTPDRPGEPLADRYARRSTSLRGTIRHRLVDRALADHLPAVPPQRVLDVGGGTGVQARMLALRGHHVTVLDPDETMLARARTAWLPHAPDAPGSITFHRGLGEQAPQLVGSGWDAVLCHGVLMYLEDPAPLLHVLAQCLRPGGIISVLAYQADALAIRRGLTRDWSGALEALRSPVEHNSIGTISRGVDRTMVLRLFADHDLDLLQWYGVRVFTDHLEDECVGEDFDQVLEAEWEAGRMDPYRRVARHFHLISRARQDRTTT
ncbi:methyltransferase domain-containing protein [Streptomyces sp. NBC_01283]|uniref:methyltransferase domain-containing protein n=1 Tax=Streptomyces sp. NBC_01283 TaxID=2903812 RepID=UPI00352DEE72|nr:methyltransferase domain-containing protein [Streptomyces sp. NBC_01283]